MIRNNHSKWLLLWCLLGSMPGQAHRLPECVTSLDWSEQEQRLEITHRLHRHDAQLALEQLTDKAVSELDSVESKARLALYVESRFGLRASEPMPLQLIGAEFDGDYLLVYQEYQGPLPDSLAVRSETLLEWNPEQINTVLVRIRDKQRQLALDAGAGWVNVESVR